jgi:two-component system, OmpR family, response regulator
MSDLERNSHVRPLCSGTTLIRLGTGARVDEGTVGAADRPRVLVVDDEPNIVNLVRMSLRFHGFDVVTAASGGEALTAVASTRPDLVVLDVMLPDADGFEVCRQLRDAAADVPVIFLTARHAHADKVAGLTYGGDDYVTKPFSVDELVARVRAVLRRTRRAGTAPVVHVVRFADVTLDEDTHEVTRAGRRLDLSPTEFKLLRYLLANPRRVLSRAQILDAVWTYDFRGGDTVVDQYVSYLRRKLAAHGPSLIVTHRGFGYMLRAPDGAG